MGTTVEMLVGAGVMLGVPGYFVLQARLAFAWTGGWRKGALAPLALIGPAILWSLYALSHGSNLWPITVILLAPPCFAYLLVLCAVRAVVSDLAA